MTGRPPTVVVEHVDPIDPDLRITITVVWDEQPAPRAENIGTYSHQASCAPTQKDTGEAPRVEICTATPGHAWTVALSGEDADALGDMLAAARVPVWLWQALIDAGRIIRRQHPDGRAEP